MSHQPGKFTKQLESLAAGLKAKPPGGATTMVVEGKSEPTADLATEIEGYYATFHAVDTTNDAHTQAVDARDKVEVTVKARTKQIRNAVKGAIGATNPDLKNYGITPDKQPQPLTTEQQAAKNAQNKATRAARHTMGSQQKKNVKGQVPPAPPLPKVGP